MARITVEDAVAVSGNRFDLVLVAAKRARQIAMYGHEPLVEWDNDKPSVVALRELEEHAITPETIETLEKQEEAAEEVGMSFGSKTVETEAEVVETPPVQQNPDE